MKKTGARIHDILCYDQGNLAQALTESGAECVQLTLPKFIPAGEPQDGFNDDLLQEIKEGFCDANVKIDVLSCYINPLSDCIEAQQEKFFRYIDYAVKMGVSIVGTETGSVVSDLKEYKKNHEESVFEKLLQNLYPIVEYAKKKNICIGIESVAYFPVRNAKTFERLKSFYKDAPMCCIFDPTNLLCIDNFQKQREIFEEFIQAHAKDIRVVHLKDFVCENEWLVEKPLFCGDLDVEFLFFLLEKYDVQADFIIENAPSKQDFLEMKKKIKSLTECNL